MIVDHHDAAVLGQRPQHLVGHVARVVGDRAARRVRGDHRRFGQRHHVVESFVGDVRDVDHHPETVHLADDVLAERGQAVVRRLVGRRVGPVVVAEVRQRHVAHAERGVDAQQPHVVVDHVAAFHPHQGRDPAGLHRIAHLRRRRRQREIVRVLADRLADRVDLIERPFDGNRSGDVARHPDRKEHRVHAAVAHPRDVDVAVAVPLADVEARVEDHALRRVGVGVEDDGAVVQLLRAGRHRVGLPGLRRLGENQRRQRKRGAADEGLP